MRVEDHYIDGDAGVLLYRGYPIEQIAESGDFLETCYFMLLRRIATPAQKAISNYGSRATPWCMTR